jgi:pathogenesis-related protein 1
VWSDDLAAGSKTWADYLATTGQFVHDSVHTGLTCTGPCYGENLAGFNPSTGISAPGEGQQLWVAEKNNWNGGMCASGKVCGHYTQMVSKDTKEVGCGTATGNNFSWSPGHPASVLVCRYR